MNINKVMKNSDIKAYEKYAKIIAAIPNSQHGQAQDAILKWCGIMNVIDTLELKPTRILDIGSGLSHLVVAIDNMLGGTVKEAICVDLEHDGCDTVLTNGKCNFIKGDFFQIEKLLQTGNFDLIVDSCAVTHFDKRSNYAKNDGCYRVGQISRRLLNQSGTLICTSDVLDSDNDEATGEFISPKAMIESYEASGLKLIGDYSGDRSDQYLVTPHGWNWSLAIAQFAFRSNS